ncbi:saccharopine dehydrogenase family protein [Microbulbifer harenosus]|uniref:Saccharopine dehydrogenase n=1 Tax=Microbulbifer harenosus TaxID=2576840 RepID=A0ABY2UJF2_9GAMM|nr:MULTISPECIES: saccharopine dehydrogenase NADP-binding domain-containing protein [Microbulbifer]QIL89072.1 saccharopine dehydrogenase [Microbulbifer sp. SH-1]TLM77806.1 saccharopine dehydrogenase [Microbulbifer harenosus]
MTINKRNEVRRILVLGGYGNFGKRIVESLSALKGITLLIAGRDAAKADKLRQQLGSNSARAALETALVDINDSALTRRIQSLAPDLVIHTSGPFQGQNYRVPEACIAAGCHYIDLADDRRFVCDITSFDARAKALGLLVVSGASSVPGLSSTVIDRFADEFSELEEVDFAIAPGNQAERGAATVRGILSYTGRPFFAFHKGKWVSIYGWMNPRKLDFGGTIGKRWLANIDIPDLELFPQRYNGVSSIRFQAGLELPILHFGMVAMASLARVGIVRNWASLTSPIVRASELFIRFGTDIGGMQINLSGLDKNQQRKRIKWTLCAENGVGPYIPTISAIILAKKLISGDIEVRGATPCLGLYSLDEFDQEASPLGIFHQVER